MKRILKQAKLVDLKEKNQLDLEIGKRMEGQLIFDTKEREIPCFRQLHVQRRKIEIQRIQ